MPADSSELLLKIGTERAKAAVMAAFYNRQWEVVYWQSDFFMTLKGTEGILIEELNRDTEERSLYLANTFLHSGNPQLEQAARSWAAANGYVEGESYSGGPGRPIE